MGEPRSRTVLYLPGIDGTGKLLYRQTALHERYRVLCASYPQDREQTYEELAEIGVRKLEEAGERGPVTVLSESFGGAVALTLTLRRPELVERLLLINTFAYFPSPWLIRLGAWAGRYLPPRPSHPATRRFRGPFFFSPEVPPRVREQWWKATDGVPLRAFGYRMDLIARLDLRPRLGEVRVPSLVLAAPDDLVVPPVAGRELAKLLPQAHLIQPRTGHAAMAHPEIDVARLLAEPRYWSGGSA